MYDSKIDPNIEQKYKIDSKRFEDTPNKPAIDKGEFWKVSFKTDKSTNLKCVSKQTKKSLSLQRLSFNREVNFLATCNHPAIVKFIGYDDSSRKGIIYLEEAENGSLYKYILESKQTKKQLNNTQKLVIAYGIARAMDYLHSNNIIHRNLHSENILLNSDLYPLVCGFGLSNYCDRETIQDSKTVKEALFSIMAPEFITDFKSYNRTKPIDVFSYAMVLYFLISEKLPFDGCGDVSDKIVNGDRPPLKKIVSHNQWKELIEKCWRQDPKDRPTFHEICTILESSFQTPEIDRELFNQYKGFIDKKSAIGDESQQETAKSPIEKLKEDADKGIPDAQNSYALHLYNGLEVEQNRELARHYFELAAKGDNYEAMLWLSLILQREGENPELTEKYFQNSIEKVPEAQSIQGQKLIEEGKVEEGSNLLLTAIQNGSISAMVAFGNLCEKDDQYGNPMVFYRMASDCCHFLDEIGFYFPVDRKVYECNTCDIKICEACAKSCHDHSKNQSDIDEVETNHSFVCECATEYFQESGRSKKCSFELVGESKFEGMPVIYQHLYQCKDCNNKSEGKFICKQCINRCHKGHNVVDCGIQKGFCSCGAKQLDNKLKCFCKYNEYPKDECTHNGKKRKQRFFQCYTCGLCKSEDKGICLACALTCHKNHIVFDRGLSDISCRCARYGKCKLKK